MTSRIVLTLMMVALFSSSPGQYLSRLHATKSDPLFTTYAAPPPRSDYRCDQAYQFRWFDDDSGPEFFSKQGPGFGVAFSKGDRLISRLAEYPSEPVITASYSDLVNYYYYPFEGMRVEAFFAVYSSRTAILQIRMKNEGAFPCSFSIHPYLYYPSTDSIQDLRRTSRGFEFPLIKRRDAWMQEHAIPLVENHACSWNLVGCTTPKGLSFVRRTGAPSGMSAGTSLEPLIRSMLRNNRDHSYLKGIIRTRTYRLEPGDITSFRMIITVAEAGATPAHDPMALHSNIDPARLLKEAEDAYRFIPRLTFNKPDQEMLYWSCFSLMRQCMMPPEGKCRHTYYVFSREPKWGWGYGGQVFHESLSMIPYAYMDPAGAMNSQRVFIDRQHPDGYINYRTGPYLDETIPHQGKLTTSAPWFSYENLEIFKISGDHRFLSEAYRAGKKLFQWFENNRDTNRNGLCEWGGHAELESVRDARVAVWDQVGWAGHFEGPDLNSLMVREARSLAEMARRLDLSKEAIAWDEKAESRKILINKHMWDSTTRFYYNINKLNHSFSFKTLNDLKIKEIIGFLPLWAGVTDSLRRDGLIRVLTDTAEFWRPNGIPTLSATHPYYNPIGYWNGPVWVQWQYLVFRGLIENGHPELANELASRVTAQMIHHLKKDHDFWEFYSADHPQAGWNRSYIWAGIATAFFLQNPTCRTRF